MRKVLLGLGLAALLTGCGDSDVQALKESRMPFDESFTIGQAFDNRKACESVEWSAFEDDRERKIIEYRCTLSGGAEYFNSLVNQSLNRTQKSAQRQIDEIKNVETDNYRAQALSREKAQLTRVQEELAALKLKASEWSNANPPSFLADPQVAKGVLYRLELPESTTYEDLIASDLSSSWENLRAYRYPSTDDLTIFREQYRLQYDTIPRLQQRIAAQKAELEEYLISIAEENEATVEDLDLKLERSYEEEAAALYIDGMQQLVQWSVADNEQFALLGVGVDILGRTEKPGEILDAMYPSDWAREVLKEIYRDEAEAAGDLRTIKSFYDNKHSNLCDDTYRTRHNLIPIKSRKCD